MNIALITAKPVPATYGGTERLLDGLIGALNANHSAKLIAPEVDERDEAGILRGYRACWNLDLRDFDLVISTKAPTCMARHRAHVPYLQHRMRVFYDLYDPRDEHFDALRRLIHWMDAWAFAPERTPEIFTIGRTVSNRMLRWGGHATRPIHHPSTFKPDEWKPGEHFLSVGRLHPWKRIDLIVKAVRMSKASTPLVIVGAGPQEAELRELAGSDERIKFAGLVDEATLRGLYARAKAVVFPPINEDLGLVTWEAFQSGKPVLTTTDAGEPALIVEEDRTGWICAPTAEAMARRFEQIEKLEPQLEGLRENCLAAVAPVTWERVADALIAAGKRRLEATAQPVHIRASPGGAGLPHSGKAKKESRIRLLVMDNQIIDPPVGGGRIRIWELYRHLPEDFVTTYAGTHDHPGPLERDRWLTENFREIIIPLTTVHFKMHEVWRRLTGGDATIDVTIPLLLGRCTPKYRRLVAKLAMDADVLAAAHPWMFPFLPAESALPRVYDSQNCEAAVKERLLRRTAAGRWIATKVEEVEREAALRSELTLACSAVDAQEFASRYGLPAEKTLLIANGVDCERVRPATAAEKKSARERLQVNFGIGDGWLAVFVGSNYRPNIEAVDCIVRQAAACADLEFALAGGAIEQWRAEHAGKDLPSNVRALGMIGSDDLTALYQSADVALNPMKQGSGTNIKMLDYFAAGLPTLTSPTGARGLEGTPGTHWVEADADGFAAVLLELKDNAEMQRSLAAESRRLAEDVYDWRRISAQYADALRKLAAAGKAKG